MTDENQAPEKTNYRDREIEATATYELVWRSRDGGPERRETATIWVDIGTLLEMKQDPEHPIDLLTDADALIDLFNDPAKFVRVLWLLSDQQAMDEIAMGKGLCGPNLRDAETALRVAFTSFFLARQSATHVQILESLVEMKWATTEAMADAAQKVNAAELVRQQLSADALSENVKSALESDIRRELEALGD